MDQINRIRKVSIWIFFLPIIVLNICLFISVNYPIFENTIFAVDSIGRTSFTIPYIDGGVSISRTARTYPAYLIFKPGMIITAFLLIKYWMANNTMAKAINKTDKNYRFLFFGIASALFLIVHSIFLGIKFDYDLYKLFRRIVLLSFIIFEITAQAYLVICLYKIKNQIFNLINEVYLKLKILLVSLLFATIIFSIPIVTMPGNKFIKHALEWDYFLGVILFYLLTNLMWKKTSS